jgi:hypothetical protein
VLDTAPLPRYGGSQSAPRREGFFSSTFLDILTTVTNILCNFKRNSPPATFQYVANPVTSQNELEESLHFANLGYDHSHAWYVCPSSTAREAEYRGLRGEPHHAGLTVPNEEVPPPIVVPAVLKINGNQSTHIEISTYILLPGAGATHLLPTVL